MPNTKSVAGLKNVTESETLKANTTPQNIEFWRQWQVPINPEGPSARSTYTKAGNSRNIVSTPTTNLNPSFTPASSLGLSNSYKNSHQSPSVSKPRSDWANENAFGVGSLNLAKFGSQPWPKTTAPHLDFGLPPSYEPTGELAHEAVHTFESFDDPSSLQGSAWSPFNLQVEPESRSENNSPSNHSQLNQPSHPEQIVPRPALKRKLEPESLGVEPEHNIGRQPSTETSGDRRKARRVSFEQMSSINPASPDEESSSDDESSSVNPLQRPNTAHVPPTVKRNLNTEHGRKDSPVVQPAVSPAPQRQNVGSKNVTGHPPPILPPEKVFPIQIGSELFRLSGASISSDAPSYFTQFFEDQIKQLEESGGVRTLYIDRDPETFRDIARHLQGYYVKPRDGNHFVKLFADAQFYQLPRLIDQLFESEIFIQIGEQHFQIPKDVFSDPGNSPNFFSLGFAVFFSSPGDVFPGLDRRGLLRPPSITPPYVPGRSAKTFAQLLHLLRGYPLNIENEIHRAELLRDCRYFHLRGLEQKIIAHEISYNLEREKMEICIRIEDVKPSGVSYRSEDTESSSSPGGWVHYARPFVDDAAHELIVEIGGESTLLDVNDMRLDFHGLAKARVSSLLQVVANKMNLPTKAPLGLMVLSGGSSTHSASPGNTPLSEDRVKVRFEQATAIKLDGESFAFDSDSQLGQLLQNGPGAYFRETEESDSNMSAMSAERGLDSQSGDQFARRSRKRRRLDSSDGHEHGRWIIRSGQWRLKIQSNPNDSIRGGLEIVFMAVKIDAFSNELARNARRGFVGSY